MRGVDVTLCKGGGSPGAPYERVIRCWQRDEPRTKALIARLPVRLTWRLGVGSAYDLEQVTFAAGLISHLRRDNIDILHVQDPGVARLARLAASVGAIKTKTILAHGTEQSADFLKRFSYVQQLAPWHLEETRRLGAAQRTWTAIPNFVNTTRFSPGRSPELRQRLGIPEDALVVLSVAAIKRHHKRIDWLLREFADLSRQHGAPDAYLIVAGGWENDTDDLIAEGERLLGDRARFLVRVLSRRYA